MSTKAQRFEVLVTSVRTAFITAVAITAYAVFVERCVKPLHARGIGQPLLDHFNGLNDLLQFPLLHAAYRAGFRPGPHPTPAVWMVGLAITAAGYGLAAFLFRVCWLCGTRPRAAVPEPGAGPARPAPARVAARRTGESRRQFLGHAVKCAGGTALAGLGYTLVIEPRWFGVTHRVIPLGGLPPALDGLRAVQLTDLHHGPWTGRAHIRQVVDAVNDLRPDLVLLTGDYVEQSRAYIRPVAEELERLQPRIAAVAVLGNHDWDEDGPLTQRELGSRGIVLLDNARRILTPQRRLVREAGEGLVLAGVGDLWRDRQDYAQALGGLPPQLPRLLLSHNPDAAEEPALVRSGHRVDLMLSGHTHGGQLRFPLLGAPVVPSRYGQKYVQGLVQGPVCPVLVCRGVGVSGLPLRLGAFPEIALLEFRAAG
jgi:predicted MPP superfamily phosphohydrolase